MLDLTGPLEDVDRRYAVLEALHRTTVAAYSAQRLEDIYDEALRALVEVVGAHRAAVLLFDTEGIMRFVAWRGLSDGYRRLVEGHNPWPAGAEPAPVTVEDVTGDRSLSELCPKLLDEGIRALAFIPLVAGGGLIGEFMLYHDAPHVFPADELEVATLLAERLAGAVVRVREDQRIRDRAEQLELALDAGEMGAWSWDTHSGEVTWTPGLERIHGLEPGGFTGTLEAFEADIHPDDRAAVRAAIGAALRAGGSYAVEYRIVRPDGALRWLAAHGEVLGETAGRRRMVGVCQDVTARKRAELLREVELSVVRTLAEAPPAADAVAGLLRSVVEGLGWQAGLLWQLGRCGDALQLAGAWHRGTEALTRFVTSSRGLGGQRGAGLPGRVWALRQPAWMVDVQEDPGFPRRPAAREAGLHTGFGFPVSVAGQLRGVVEFFTGDVLPPDEDVMRFGASLGAHLGQLLERRQAEDELRLRQALLESENEASLEAIVAVEGGCVLAVNHRFTEMWGVAPADDGQLREALLAQVENPDALREVLTRLDGDPALSYRCELDLIDGRVVDLWTTPLRDAGRESPVRAWYFRDVSSEKQEQRECQASRDRFALLSEAGRAFTSSLDVAANAAVLADLAVPRLVPWCAVHLAADGGGEALVVVRHHDGTRRPLAEAWAERVAGRFTRPRHGDAVRVLYEPAGELATDAEESSWLQGAGFTSAVVAPLTSRGRALGRVTFAGRRFSPDDVQLLQILARRGALAIENARLFQERTRIAHTLQQALLPPDLPEVPGVDLAARYRPAEGEVGGDFYDVVRLEPGRWLITVGDVCGHGVEAAACTAMLRYTLRTVARDAHTPAGILTVLNDAVAPQLGDDQFCTVVCAVIDRTVTPTAVSVACAGHPLPLLRHRDGRVETVGCAGTLLGAFPTVSVSESHVTVGPGDTLVFYTDGATVDGEVEPIRAALTGAGHLGAGGVADVVRAVADQTGHNDDVAVVAARFFG